MANENMPSYIARERCGCVVGAVVDDPNHPEQVKESLREFINDSLVIERVTVGYVREHFLDKCPVHNGTQPKLFEAER
jgi:hypothetical protein